MIKFLRGLTQSCQSGRKLAGAVLLAGAAIPALCGAQAVSWAHQNGSLQSNGSITIKSQSGGSYAGQVNPAGAVAKPNQSAVTQPPTVIIQSTAGGARECQAKLNSANGSSVAMPSCSAGYTSIFQASAPLSGYACPAPNTDTFNIGGSNWSFGMVSVSNVQAVGFMNDNKPLSNTGQSPAGNQTAVCAYSSFTYSWAANLCCK